MENNLIEQFWIRLQSQLNFIAESVTNESESVSYEIGKKSNKAFPLSAYLSFIKDKQNGDEIVISVYIVNRNGELVLESDICKEEKILAIGPKAEMEELSENTLSIWIEKFDIFLHENNTLLKIEIPKLN